MGVQAVRSPGQWDAVPVTVGSLNLVTGKASEQVPAGWSIRASEPVRFGGTILVPSGLRQPDAVLMAAAPELLDALVSARFLLLHPKSERARADRARVLRAIEAAIKKATTPLQKEGEGS